jgi:hypothetical protein
MDICYKWLKLSFTTYKLHINLEDSNLLLALQLIQPQT